MYAAVSAAWEKRLASDQDASERVGALEEVVTYKIVKLYGRDTLVDT
jgi:hypothetical protein